MNEIIFNNVSMPVIDGCGLCAAAEPFFHADRTVNFNILIYVLEGKIYVTEDDTDYTIGSGELLFLKNRVHHYGKYEIQRGTRWYFVHFYFEEKEGLCNFVPDSSPISQYEHIEYESHLPKKLTGLSGSDIEKRILTLDEFFLSADTMKKWKANMKFCELLTEIAFYESTAQKPQSLSDKICEYLNNHSNENFSSKQLENRFYLSYKYMAAVFKKEKELTMQQYHTEQRMNKAQTLLSSTLIPVGEISRMLGFTDMLYFSRCFRQYTGTSPTEYRKNAAKLY